MSSPSPTSSTDSSGNTNPRLSTHAEIGLVVGPLVFIFIVATFWLVSRKRQLSCFRPDDVETQRKQQKVDQFMARLSTANGNGSKKDPAEMDMREAGGSLGQLTRQGTLYSTATTAADLPDQSPQLPPDSTSPSVPRPVCNPSPKPVVSQITLAR